jgi:hypothetical protein
VPAGARTGEVVAFEQHLRALAAGPCRLACECAETRKVPHGVHVVQGGIPEPYDLKCPFRSGRDEPYRPILWSISLSICSTFPNIFTFVLEEHQILHSR